jgi:transcriptional regulator with XRE-family HTH domain
MRRANVAKETPGVMETGDSPQLDEPGAGETLAERLNFLFKQMRPRGRGEFTLEEVCTGMRERRGVKISPAYLSQLRKGTRANPSRQVVEALADFFGVKPSYFYSGDDAEAITAQIELFAAMRDAGVRDIALRAARLSPAGLRAIARMIDEVQRLEQAVAGPRKTQHDPAATQHPEESG